jgi:hypothetical protein
MRRYHLLLDQWQNLTIRIGMTLGWMNALNLKELYSMYSQEFSKFGFNISLIHSPANLALWAIPTSAKTKIAIDWDLLAGLVPMVAGPKQFMFSTVSGPEIIESTLENIEILDQYRNENIFSAIPGLSELLND